MVAKAGAILLQTVCRIFFRVIEHLGQVALTLTAYKFLLNVSRSYFLITFSLSNTTTKSTTAVVDCILDCLQVIAYTRDE